MKDWSVKVLWNYSVSFMNLIDAITVYLALFLIIFTSLSILFSFLSYIPISQTLFLQRKCKLRECYFVFFRNCMVFKCLNSFLNYFSNHFFPLRVIGDWHFDSSGFHFWLIRVRIYRDLLQWQEAPQQASLLMGVAVREDLSSPLGAT